MLLRRDGFWLLDREGLESAKQLKPPGVGHLDMHDQIMHTGRGHMENGPIPFPAFGLREVTQSKERNKEDVLHVNERTLWLGPSTL